MGDGGKTSRVTVGRLQVRSTGPRDGREPVNTVVQPEALNPLRVSLTPMVNWLVSLEV